MRRSRRTLKQRSNVVLLNNSSPCVFYFEMLSTYMRGGRTVRSRCHIGGWHQNKMAGNSLKEGEHEEVDVVGGPAGDAYRRRGPGHSADRPRERAGDRGRGGRPVGGRGRRGGR